MISLKKRRQKLAIECKNLISFYLHHHDTAHTHTHSHTVNMKTICCIDLTLCTCNRTNTTATRILKRLGPLNFPPFFVVVGVTNTHTLIHFNTLVCAFFLVIIVFVIVVCVYGVYTCILICHCTCVSVCALSFIDD